ncbi:hypothetical protein BU26DRAFT_135101 [Trematosphaeria pertusa]|uniref:Uncharacterized protein n=1 Tax=Trematosphaeria pertusa TaxID=390896 RepID=A0A6A6IUJ7_9PLEO|nr:uncharacterized protein BU26DRAFT_135101 [Trematosphaeria pertusa]KAF2254235.1 hypothetical protein BU26DRAFT_135101 [Trematosphaeria pertusa]
MPGYDDASFAVESVPLADACRFKTLALSSVGSSQPYLIPASTLGRLEVSLVSSVPAVARRRSNNVIALARPIHCQAPAEDAEMGGSSSSIIADLTWATAIIVLRMLRWIARSSRLVVLRHRRGASELGAALAVRWRRRRGSVPTSYNYEHNRGGRAFTR